MWYLRQLTLFVCVYGAGGGGDELITRKILAYFYLISKKKHADKQSQLMSGAYVWYVWMTNGEGSFFLPLLLCFGCSIHVCKSIFLYRRALRFLLMVKACDENYSTIVLC